MKFIATLIVLMLPVLAFAQNTGGSENFAKLTDEELIQGFVESNFFTIDCEIPYIQPKLCNLSSLPTTNESQLVDIFFGEKEKINSQEQINNALFVFRFSVLATVFNIFSMPFQGLITALEKFSVRVSIEIIRSILRLLFVITLIYFTGDKLKLYAVLMSILALIPSSLFIIYCKKKYVSYIINEQLLEINLYYIHRICDFTSYYRRKW